VDYIKSFKDLKLQREMHEQLKEAAETNKEYYRRLLHKDEPHELSAINMDGLPHGNGNAMSLDRIITYIGNYDNMIYIEQCIIENLEKLEREITEKVKQLDNIDFKVVYMRDILGMQLQEVADELGYDYGYIKNISRRNKSCDFNVTDNIEI